MISFTVPGPPRGKGRPRFARVGKFTRTYTDEKTASYENLVALYAVAARRGKPPIEGPVELAVIFMLPRPKSKKRASPHVKPDIDNLVKGVLDGCNQAGVWADDAQVVDLRASKEYGEPGAHVTITEAKINDER